MKRWYCIICGSGRLAPKSLPMRDVRRWCLACSPRQEGLLVPRYRAPSVEAAKKKAEHEAAKEAGRQRAREAEKAREVLKAIVSSDPPPKPTINVRLGCNTLHQATSARCVRVALHKGDHRGHDPSDGMLVVWK